MGGCRDEAGRETGRRRVLERAWEENTGLGGMGPENLQRHPDPTLVVETDA